MCVDLRILAWLRCWQYYLEHRRSRCKLKLPCNTTATRYNYANQLATFLPKPSHGWCFYTAKADIVPTLWCTQSIAYQLE